MSVAPISRKMMRAYLRVCTHRKRQRVRERVRATNYPFVKLMEIAESVLTGRVRARVFFKRQATKF